MAKELPTSANDIAAVAESAGQLGIETDSILSFTRTIIDLGEATNLTREQAATEFARFANIVGMSQKDFDRLGSSVVSLGNSMATTESEIVSMGMRLAAQGSLVGMTEAQIMALAATMSSLGIEAEAGGTAMTMVLKKIDAAVGEGGKSLKGFASAAGASSKEFADAWKKDPIVALDMFIKGLAKSGKEGDNLSKILADLGIKGIRESDTILRMAGASDLLAGAVENSTEAWKENTALSDEAAQRYKTTESQLKIMWNRVKDVAITLGDSLVPAVMAAIDAAEPLIEKIESGAQAFADMDKEQQQTILKLIALVAAIGPAAAGLGSMTTAIGGVMKVGGGLFSLLGKAGGAGLIGRIGMLGPMATSPVGLAIAGVGALTLGIYALNKANQESIEDILKSIETRKEEIDSLDELIFQYEELKNKNRLSTDEVLRYMDIMSELKDAKSEETIKKLTKEQQELLKKSGLTNDEMEEFLSLNDQIVEKAPESAKAISEQGNAYAAVLDELKKLNEAERQRLTDDTYMALTGELDKQAKNLEKQADLQDQIKEKEAERSKALEGILTQNEKIQELDLNIADLRDRIKNATDEEKVALAEKLVQAQDEKALQEAIKDAHEQTLGKIDKQIGKKEKSLKETEKELAAFDRLKDEYEQMIVFQAGLTSEKGKGVQKLQEEQKAINKAREELRKKKHAQEISTAEYQEQNNKLNEQQKKIDTAKGKLEAMNEVAGRTIYKDVNVKTNPSADEINKALGGSVRKVVNVSMTAARMALSPFNLIKGYKDGVDNHPGGPFIAGEEGFELGRLGNRWELLNLGMYDRPRGYQVFTHDESKKILRALNNLPAYASGARSPGEANRVITRLSESTSQEARPVVIELNLTNTMDGRVVGQVVEKYITQIQESNRSRKNRARGLLNA